MLRQLAIRRTVPRTALALAVVCVVGLFSLLRAHVAVQAAGSCSVSRSLTPDSDESDLIARINAYRSQSGLSTLSVSPALMASAAWKSTDLGANGYFAHDDLIRSWTQRIRDCGYGDTPNVAENIAAGYQDAASTFDQWRNSSGHNANMLNPSWKAIGLARAYNAGSPYGWYWTANFGALAPSTSNVASPPASTITSTSATTGPLPSAAVTTPSAPASAPSGAQLTMNGTAVVAGTGDCLRIHSSPTLASDVKTCLPDGTGMIVTEGPVTADGYTWWRLGAVGWAVDKYLTGLPSSP